MAVNRYICSVLDEMRTAVRVGRIDMLVGLIEEAQTLANRMESKLADYKELGYDLDKTKELKADIKKLREQLGDIEDSCEITLEMEDADAGPEDWYICDRGNESRCGSFSSCPHAQPHEKTDNCETEGQSCPPCHVTG